MCNVVLQRALFGREKRTKKFRCGLCFRAWKARALSTKGSRGYLVYNIAAAFGTRASRGRTFPKQQQDRLAKNFGGSFLMREFADFLFSAILLPGGGTREINKFRESVFTCGKGEERLFREAVFARRGEIEVSAEVISVRKLAPVHLRGCSSANSPRK